MRKLRISFEEFAARVEKAYDGRISVIEETYTGTRNKVTAYCNVHKIYFEVNVARDLYRRRVNCPKCIKEDRNKSKIKPWLEVYNSFIKKYGNKFSYDEKTYKGTKLNMKIHCNDCSEDFEITPVHHLKYNNGGCPNCHKTKTVKCSKCGKDIVVDRRCSTNTKYICNECRFKFNKKIRIKRNSNSNSDYLKYCRICGRPLHNNKCENEFCNTYQYQTLIVLVKKFGFDKNKIGTIEVEEEFKRVRDMIYDMYWNQHMSSTEICKKCGYKSVHTLVNSLFKKLKIPPKTLSQSNSENIKMGRLTAKQNTKYKTEYHITWENKEVYLRSSYEIDYASYLDENKTAYEVESLRISYWDSQKDKERIAIPDFYLPGTNTIVEIKSSWTLDVVNMIDKVKAYKEHGYDFKLILEHKEVDIYDLLL